MESTKTEFAFNIVEGFGSDEGLLFGDTIWGGRVIIGYSGYLYDGHFYDGQVIRFDGSRYVFENLAAHDIYNAIDRAILASQQVTTV